MSALTRHVILNCVDAPLKYLIWTKAEIGMFLAPALMGLMLKQSILGLIVSFLNYRLFKLYQERFGKDQFQAVWYWFLPHRKKQLPAIPPSYGRHYIG
jgi:hypothetical protein